MIKDRGNRKVYMDEVKGKYRKKKGRGKRKALDKITGRKRKA